MAQATTQVDGDDERRSAVELQLMTGNSRFEDARLAQESMFLMNRFGSLGSALTNGYLRACELKVRHYCVLSLACEQQAPTQRELSDFLVLDPSQVVALVDYLEGMDLVRRAADPRDRRSKIIVPTDRGRQALKDAEAQVAAASDRLQSNLSESERAQLQGLLHKLAAS
ncbi:MarR family winged helix-turn-helix transcriptional regulator [Kocuria sp.]|uniref:MarR family winged helix-turn-helix transcriptional regulator n=1 Tax=Kocuria sp. TaxID=1871328 RepID=UPI0026E003C7|nr:MarR family winged helix-turn-helix transcriptional regulator [Kocuria sp.]MDO5619147.1 MarR family winged helix-turn-helix transcriptional regulator [Kocuria sp.]